MACIQNRWWVNRVGTYGMASAQLYWGRQASLVLRLLYYIFPQVDWHLVFVDDYCWVLRCSRADWDATAILATLLALGVPLSWKKTALSRSIPGWDSWWTQSRPACCWLQSSTSLSWPLSNGWPKRTSSPARRWNKPWAGFNGLLRRVPLRNLFSSPFGAGRRPAPLRAGHRSWFVLWPSFWASSSTRGSHWHLHLLPHFHGRRHLMRELANRRTMHGLVVGARTCPTPTSPE